jgi:hypothetical protein
MATETINSGSDETYADDHPGGTALVVTASLDDAVTTPRSILSEKRPDAVWIAKHHGVLRAPLLIGRLSDRDEVDLGLEQ